MKVAQAELLDVLTIGMFEQLPVNVRKATNLRNFSAVFCDQNTDLSQEAIITLRAAATHDLFPIYWFGENPPEFVDGAFPEISHQFLHEATRDAYEKLSRIAKLGSTRPKEDREGLNVLGYLATRQCDAVPAWAPGSRSSVAYSRLRPDLASRSLLTQLYRQGLLERDYWRKTHLCGRCGSSRLNVAENCPECRSSDLQELDIVHHFSCGHQGPQDAFQLSAGGRMICPSCEQNLNHFGVDYDKPGRVEKCGNCHVVTESPDVYFECLDCAELTLSDEAPQRDWYHYRLSQAGREALLLGRLPVPGLENALGEFEPSKDYATFVALLDNGLSTAQRYGRPFSIAAVRINTGQDDLAQPVRFDSAMRETLIKLLRETLRDSDFLYAAGDQIVFAFPETDASEFDAIVRRIDDGLGKNLTGHPDYRFEDWSDRSVRDILREVRNVR